jgi:glyceraldehyde-3-phosphate dehydrogenase/erythrose-4-phosphate dehydrogenase
MRTIAVHGFRRIGRPLVKAALRDGPWSPASISDVEDPVTLAALFEFDSNYGRWPTPRDVLPRTNDAAAHAPVTSPGMPGVRHAN